jgi:hypothetical protein
VPATFGLAAINLDRRPALCPDSRINHLVLQLNPSRQIDPEHPENSPGFAAAATLTRLRGSSLESPQASETNLFAPAASTISEDHWPFHSQLRISDERPTQGDRLLSKRAATPGDA